MSRTRTRRTRTRLAVMLLASLLAGPALSAPADGAPRDADRKAVHNIRGFLPDLRFDLVGAGGQTVSQNDFRGKVVMLFFGYASCPDICPTTMAQLAQVRHNLGAAGQQVRILFVSVDPHRDTPDVLQAYVRLFDPHAIGLTGSEQQIAEVARRYRVAYQIEKPKVQGSDDYEVAHGRGIYVFDQQGRARLLASDEDPVPELTREVAALLN